MVLTLSSCRDHASSLFRCMLSPLGVSAFAVGLQLEAIVEFPFGQTCRVGLGSFAFRYAVGTEGFSSPRPMDCLQFLRTAHQLGYQGVQFCENLMYARSGRDELVSLGQEARKLGMFVELGMNSLTDENLARHLEIAEIVGADLTRIVLGGERSTEPSPRRVADATSILKNAIPQSRRQQVTLGIENHFDLSTSDIVAIARAIDDEQVGLIFDATNALGFLEKPADTFALMRSYLIACHIKDYRIEKIEGGYFITGARLGTGMLDVNNILPTVLALPRKISVVLESFQRRQDQWTIDEVIYWERRQIEVDTIYLLECLEWGHPTKQCGDQCGRN